MKPFKHEIQKKKWDKLRKRRLLQSLSIGGCSALVFAGAGAGVGYVVWHKQESKPTPPPSPETPNYVPEILATISGAVQQGDTTTKRTITVTGYYGANLSSLNVPTDGQFSFGESWNVIENNATISVAWRSANIGIKNITIFGLGFSTNVYIEVLSPEPTKAISAIVNGPVKQDDPSIEATITVTGYNNIDLSTLEIPTTSGFKFGNAWTTNSDGTRSITVAWESADNGQDVDITTNENISTVCYVGVIPSDSIAFLNVVIDGAVKQGDPSIVRTITVTGYNDVDLTKLVVPTATGFKFGNIWTISGENIATITIWWDGVPDGTNIDIVTTIPVGLEGDVLHSTIYVPVLPQDPIKAISATIDGAVKENDTSYTRTITVKGYNEADLSTLSIPSAPGLAFDEAWSGSGDTRTINVSWASGSTSGLDVTIEGTDISTILHISILKPESDKALVITSNINNVKEKDLAVTTIAVDIKKFNFSSTASSLELENSPNFQIQSKTDSSMDVKFLTTTTCGSYNLQIKDNITGTTSNIEVINVTDETSNWVDIKASCSDYNAWGYWNPNLNELPNPNNFSVKYNHALGIVSIAFLNACYNSSVSYAPWLLWLPNNLTANGYQEIPTFTKFNVANKLYINDGTNIVRTTNANGWTFEGGHDLNYCCTFMIKVNDSVRPINGSGHFDWVDISDTLTYSSGFTGTIKVYKNTSDKLVYIVCRELLYSGATFTTDTNFATFSSPLNDWYSPCDKANGPASAGTAAQGANPMVYLFEHNKLRTGWTGAGGASPNTPVSNNWVPGRYSFSMFFGITG